MLYNVKAGILGLEPLGMQYADLIKQHVKNLNLIAASGRTQKELLFAKNDLSLEYVYNDEKALFDSHDVDALFIFSDVRFRAHQAIQAIDKGKHVFLVNPIALNKEDAQAVWKTADSHPSQTVMCGSTELSSFVFKKTKQIIDDGTFGALEYIQVDGNYIANMNKNYTLPSGSHYLDSLLDEIQMCLSLDSRRPDKVTVNRYGQSKTVQLSMEGVPIWRFHIGKNPSKQTGMLWVQFEKARIIVLGNEKDRLKIYTADGQEETIKSDTPFEFNFPEYTQIHHFTQTILGKEKNTLKLDLAKESISYSSAIERADVLGQSIEID